MRVHLTGSIRNLNVDPPIFETITRTIHDNSGILTLSWIETMIRLLKDNEGNTERLQWDAIVAENIDAIKRADVVIIEGTKYNFNQGYQLAAALEYKKPTLFLFKGPIPGAMITGFDNPLFTYKSYDDVTELEKIVKAFLRKNTISTKDLRFNFFINRKINNYLQEMSYETGKNKSEIIREVLERKIKEQNT